MCLGPTFSKGKSVSPDSFLQLLVNAAVLRPSALIDLIAMINSGRGRRSDSMRENISSTDFDGRIPARCQCQLLRATNQKPWLQGAVLHHPLLSTQYPKHMMIILQTRKFRNTPFSASSWVKMGKNSSRASSPLSSRWNAPLSPALRGAYVGVLVATAFDSVCDCERSLDATEAVRPGVFRKEGCLLTLQKQKIWSLERCQHPVE